MKQHEKKAPTMFMAAIEQAWEDGLTFEQFLSTLEHGLRDGQIVYEWKGEIMKLEELRAIFEDHREAR